MQNPTAAQPHESIRRFGGLFDQADSPRRPEGTVTNGQNVWEKQGGDADRRPGRSLESVAAAAILFVQPLVFDDGAVFSAQQEGSTGAYGDFSYANPGIIPTKTAFKGGTPGQMPTWPYFILPFMPTGGVPDLVPIIRSVSEARLFATGADDYVWPALTRFVDVYDPSQLVSGRPKRIATGVYSKKEIQKYQQAGYMLVLTSGIAVAAPKGTEMPLEFYWLETLAYPLEAPILLDAQIIPKVNAIATSYVKTQVIEGSASIANFSAADDLSSTYVDSDEMAKEYSPTSAKWNAALSAVCARLNSLTRVNKTGSQVALEGKYGAVTQVEELSDCSVAKDWALNHILDGWVAHAWSNGYAFVDKLKSYDKTDTAALGKEASVVRVRGSISADLNILGGIASTNSLVYLKVSPPTDLVAGQNPPVLADSTYHFYTNATSGAVWTSDLINDSETPPPWTLACPLAAPFGSGWQIDDVVAILERQMEFPAAYAGLSDVGFVNVITPEEYFRPADWFDVDTTETDIVWGRSKLSPSGAASRSYPAGTATGSDEPMTSTNVIDYTSKSPGFDAKRFFDAPYRPCVMLNLSYNAFQKSGSTTKLTLRMYVNAVKVVEMDASAVSGRYYFAFSIRDVGDYGDFYPPDNDPTNNYLGWIGPQVRFTLQADAGTVSMSSATRLSDYVLLYPFA